MQILLFFLQILVQIVDASSVITWDFDVCKGDIVFNIYHSKRSPQPPKKDTLGAHSISSPGGNNVQLIDRVWQLGRDYSMVEPPLICREGESVQVTVSTCSGFVLRRETVTSFLLCTAVTACLWETSRCLVPVPLGMAPGDKGLRPEQWLDRIHDLCLKCVSFLQKYIHRSDLGGKALCAHTAGVQGTSSARPGLGPFVSFPGGHPHGSERNEYVGDYQHRAF